MISLNHVSKTYETPAGKFAALKNIDLEIRAGEFVGVVGKSGSGKSTLLNMVAGIDRPSSGSVAVAGTEIHALSENKLAAWRGRNVGFVFQFFQLLPTLTAAENVMLPMDFSKTIPLRERRKRAVELLERVGSRQRTQTNCRRRFQAASNSASRSRGHSRTSRRWSSQTSPPAISTPSPPLRFSISFATWLIAALPSSSPLTKPTSRA